LRADGIGTAADVASVGERPRAAVGLLALEVVDERIPQLEQALTDLFPSQLVHPLRELVLAFADTAIVSSAA
jgi:hypothetical protein